jgi:hypothetical protein
VALTMDGVAVAIFHAVEAAGFVLGQVAVVLRFVGAFALAQPHDVEGTPRNRGRLTLSGIAGHS